MKRAIVWIVGGASVAAIMAGVVAARAGWKYTFDQVTIDLTNNTAQGQVGAVRNNSDNTSWIGCNDESSTSGGNVSYEKVTCFAQDASGTLVSCWQGQTTAPSSQWIPSLVSAAKSLNGDSYLQFNWDSNGHCTYIRVENISYHAPKVL